MLVRGTGSNVLAASVYLDRTEDPTHQVNKLNKIVDYALKNNFELIINGDFNSHFDWWGNRETDRRGEKIKEFILEAGLELGNDGSMMWKNNRYSTAIDLSLVSPNLGINAWSANFDSGSDHVTIILEVNK